MDSRVPTPAPLRVTTVDTQYQFERCAAVHMLVQSGRAALVDCGTTRSVPLVLEALRAHGVERDQVDWVFVTHAHLDHAGGAGALAQALPRAVFVAHPRAVPHLGDPKRLCEASRVVYGADRFDSLYGEVVGVPLTRLVGTEDGSPLSLGDQQFRVMHSPGHALHHHVLHGQASSGDVVVFTGDAFGLAYPALTTASGPLLLPTTTPSQFDPIAMTRTIRNIAALAPTVAYLTHFGELRAAGGLQRLALALEQRVAASVAIAEAHAAAPDAYDRIRQGLEAQWSEALANHGVADPALALALLRGDLDLNAQGLVAWLHRRQRAAPSGSSPGA